MSLHLIQMFQSETYKTTLGSSVINQYNTDPPRSKMSKVHRSRSASFDVQIIRDIFIVMAKIKINWNVKNIVFKILIEIDDFQDYECSCLFFQGNI